MTDEGVPAPRGRCRTAAPGMPSADVARTAAHDRRLPDGSLLFFGSLAPAAG
jgi:hypothetical protein